MSDTIAPTDAAEDRELPPAGICQHAPDKMHHYRVVDSIESVDHYVCRHCPSGFFN